MSDAGGRASWGRSPRGRSWRGRAAHGGGGERMAPPGDGYETDQMLKLSIQNLDTCSSLCQIRRTQHMIDGCGSS
ncbi:hypothetical protein, partial [Streptomyces sp. NPDC001919]